MKTELFYLVLVTAFTGLLWIPYIFDRLATCGLMDAVGYPENPKPQSAWAQRLMRAQSTEGSIVLISSANGVVAKRGSWAYDTSKAALNHLIRELAVEYAPHIRVNGVAPASVVEGSLQFPRERVLSSLAKYGIPFAESETTEALRDKLSGFYAERTLLKRKIRPTDVAEAVYLLVSPHLAATTGHVIPVDAGLTEAFVR